MIHAHYLRKNLSGYFVGRGIPFKVIIDVSMNNAAVYFIIAAQQDETGVLP